MKRLLPLAILLLAYSTAHAQFANYHRVYPNAASYSLFNVMTNDLENKTPTFVFSDDWREVNHARVSPDHNWVLFTRHNTRGPSGYALETDSYYNTEAIVCGITGSPCYDVLPPHANLIQANATWTPDQTGILFISSATPFGNTGIARLDIAAGRSNLILYNRAVNFGDPNQVGSQIVLTMQNNLAVVSGGVLTPITSGGMDYDPKLSPDGSTVAAMRQVGDEYHVITVPTAGGPVTDLSNVTEAMPEWSADGSMWLYWGMGDNHLAIFTMSTDGSNRAEVSLGAGYNYTMGAFWPGSNDQFAYSARIP